MKVERNVRRGGHKQKCPGCTLNEMRVLCVVQRKPVIVAYWCESCGLIMPTDNPVPPSRNTHFNDCSCGAKESIRLLRARVSVPFIVHAFNERMGIPMEFNSLRRAWSVWGDYCLNCKRINVTAKTRVEEMRKSREGLLELSSADADAIVCRELGITLEALQEIRAKRASRTSSSGPSSPKTITPPSV